MGPAVPVLAPWANFYMIVGSAAAALTGLQFVVMSFIGDRRAVDQAALEAFGTPTIVHFCAVLLLAALASAPWPTERGLVVALVLTGAAGIAYTVIVTWRAMRQSRYAPVLEDWLWHSLFPLASYGILGAASVRMGPADGWSAFTIGAAMLFLLFIGIHNAWDTVAWNAVQRGEKGEPAPPSS